jgi:hypothetical protein
LLICLIFERETWQKLGPNGNSESVYSGKWAAGDPTRMRRTKAGGVGQESAEDEEEEKEREKLQQNQEEE